MVDRHKITALRKAAGLTQVEFAERIMVAQTTIAQIETGIKQPSVALLKRIADTLGVRMDELLSERAGA